MKSVVATKRQKKHKKSLNSFCAFCASCGSISTSILSFRHTRGDHHDSSAFCGRSAAPDLHLLAGFSARTTTDTGSRTRPKRSHSAHQGRRPEALAGHADAELPERCHWTTPDCVSGNEARKRMDPRSTNEVRTSECPPRSVGTIWSRLDLETVLRAGD